MDIRLDTSQAKAPAGGVRCVQNPGGTPGCVVGNIVSLYRGRFHRVFCIAVGAILLLSAALKSWQYLQSPIPPYELQHFPGLEPVLIAWETFFGLWLISGALPIASRRVAIGCFSVFGCYALYEAVSGRTSCGCFGQVHVNPWYTFILDVSLVLMLTFVGKHGTGNAEPSRWAQKKWPVAATAAVGLAVGFAAAMVHPKVVSAANGLATAHAGKLVILEPDHWLGHRLPVLADIVSVSCRPGATGLQHEAAKLQWTGDLRQDVDDTGITGLQPRMDGAHKMSLSQRLAHGQWIVMFYHASCEECRRTIPVYEALAQREAMSGQTPHVAFVRVPSNPQNPVPPGLFNSRLARHGTLDSSHEWFATTPIVVALRDGIVRRVAVGHSAMNPQWMNIRAHGYVTAGGIGAIQRVANIVQ